MFTRHSVAPVLVVCLLLGDGTAWTQVLHSEEPGKQEQTAGPIISLRSAVDLDTIHIHQTMAVYLQQLKRLEDEVRTQAKRNAQLQQDIDALTSLCACRTVASAGQSRSCGVPLALYTPGIFCVTMGSLLAAQTPAGASGVRAGGICAAPGAAWSGYCAPAGGEVAIWPGYLVLRAWWRRQFLPPSTTEADLLLALVDGVQMSACILWVGVGGRALLQQEGWGQRVWELRPELCRFLRRVATAGCLAGLVLLVPLGTPEDAPDPAVAYWPRV